MIRLYDDLNEVEQDELANAWVNIVEGLRVYGRLTGAGSLDDFVYESLWNEIELQKNEGL